MIKLLALDIDDTLTNIPREIPPENAAAVRRAQEAGIYVTVATGRGYFSSSYIWKALNIRGPLINYGGALVYDSVTGNILHATSLPNPVIQSILSDAAALRVHAHLYQNDTVVTQTENAYTDRYTKVLGLPMRVEPRLRELVWENVPKVLILTEPERAEGLIPRLQEKYRGVAKVSGSSPGFIEFNDPHAHKGSALAFVAERMGVSMEQVCAVGDNTLDLEMIEMAGLGAAVANAQPAVLAAASIVVPACAENGVAYLIDNILLKG